MACTVAIIGSGNIARDHLAALRQIPEVEVAYVYGSNLDRAASLAALYPGAKATTDIRQILDDPAINAVDITNSTPDHARFTIAAGLAGKHVHVEKPAALNLGDFDSMVAATEGRGLSLMVGQTVRFQPSIATIAQAIQGGDIGTPRLTHVSWYTGYVWPGGWRGWQLDAAKSGGHPVHNGSHCIDLAVWLLQRTPVRVFARSFPSYAAQMPVHDSFQLTVKFDDGSLALLEISYSLRKHADVLRRIVVAGSEGTLAHSTTDDPGLTSDGARPAPSSVENAMTAQLRHWVDLMEGRAEPIVRTAEVRAALATGLAAQESLDTGRAVNLSIPSIHEKAKTR
ncbi:Gfo/Idh/MocA family protein [Pseudarthrobacter sp. P1]|uniref:Gfo/Idh/MocA family protein n=1 Tax=Pseudarthrobacter sp. P1 TaxID=3418418 RepID=UPI003CFA0B9B